MVRVCTVIPAAVCRVVNQVVLYHCICGVDRYNTVTCNIMYIVVADRHIAAADPFAVSCILISGITACSTYQFAACPYALHVDCFVAYIVYFISFNGKSCVVRLYGTGMIAAVSCHKNDQSACAFVCATGHLTIDIMDLIVADGYVCQFAAVTVLYYETG